MSLNLKPLFGFRALRVPSRALNREVIAIGVSSISVTRSTNLLLSKSWFLEREIFIVSSDWDVGDISSSIMLILTDFLFSFLASFFKAFISSSSSKIFSSYSSTPNLLAIALDTSLATLANSNEVCFYASRYIS